MNLPFLTMHRATQPPAAGPGRLGWDFHNHLLPNVDDGIESIAQACAAIDALRSVGFTGAVVTPHIYTGMFDNAPDRLRESFAAFTAGLAAAGEDFPVFLAAEYFADENFLELIRRDELVYLPVGAERWVLVEFPYFQASEYAGICLSALAARGYRPVIAHVERYRFVAEAPRTWLARFARAGAILQGDIGSLAGQHGESVRRFGKWLQGRSLVPLWGTDLHRPAQVAQYIAPGLKQLGLKQLNTLLEPIMAPLRMPVEARREPCAA